MSKTQINGLMLHFPSAQNLRSKQKPFHGGTINSALGVQLQKQPLHIEHIDHIDENIDENIENIEHIDENYPGTAASGTVLNLVEPWSSSGHVENCGALPAIPSCPEHSQHEELRKISTKYLALIEIGLRDNTEKKNILKQYDLVMQQWFRWTLMCGLAVDFFMNEMVPSKSI